MDIKKFAIRIGRCLAGRRGFGVNGRAVDGGLAFDGSGSALDSPGAWALIGYPIVFPSPFSRAQDQEVRPKRKKQEENNKHKDHTDADLWQN